MSKNSKFESLVNKGSVVLYALGIMLALMGYVNQDNQESNNKFIEENILENSNLQNQSDSLSLQE